MPDPVEPPAAAVQQPVQNFFAHPPERINIQSQTDKARIWKDWIQQYSWFEQASGIKDLPAQRQVGILMNSLGPDVIGTFKGLQLTEAEQQDPEAIKKAFSDAYSPTANPTYSTYVFLKTDQLPGESFDNFLIKLRAAIRDCDFGTEHEGMNINDRLLKDKIVLGISSQKVREKLLSDPKLTLEKAIQICKASEKTTETLMEMDAESRSCNAVRSDDGNPFLCKRCGSKHVKKSCPAFGKQCLMCQGTGHFAKCCFKKKKKEADAEVNVKNENRKAKKAAAVMKCEEEDSSDAEVDLHLHAVGADDDDDDGDWFEEATIANMKMKFKLDCGAQCNVLPLKVAKKISNQLQKSKTKYIVSYNGEKTKVEGDLTVTGVVNKRKTDLTFKVVDLDVVPILGKKTCVDMQMIQRVNAISSRDDIFQGLGCFKNFEYELDLKPEAVFEIRPTRAIPYKIRDEVKEELDRMIEMGVITKQEEPTPVVSNLIVVRKNNRIRLCIDPTDVNKNILRRHYPLRTLEEIAARIRNAKWFTILDCKKGFWQVKIAEKSQKYLTFGTPWGRYSCLRLPFGLASAPEVFQNLISTLLEGITGTDVSMDDILIYAETQDKLNEITTRVVNRLRNAGLKLNPEKCQFAKKSVTYLGHVVSAEGLQSDGEKIEAIRRLKVPENRKQLQRLLGMVTYLAKFIVNLSQITAPLRQLLQKDVLWQWEPEQQAAFDKIMNLLTSLPVLKFYDVNKQSVLSVDCSSHAMGAVLLQDGHPIAYASKSLTSAQRNYPQIEKEAFAIRFGCQKFHSYIFGKPVVVHTDHKPLESIFKKPLDKAPPRLKRIILDVQPYAPEIVYVRGENVPIADALSRDVNNPTPENDEELEVHVVLNVSKTWMKELVAKTSEDVTLRKLIETIKAGWPNEPEEVDLVLKPYWNYRDELSTYEGLIFKGDRLLIPETLRSKTLNIIHAGHFGIQSSIMRAKQLVFWPSMGKDIERLVEQCRVCQKHSRSNVKEPMIVKQVPEYPFQIVGSDIFHFNDANYIVIIDSYSGWIDFKKLRSMESSEVIDHLQSWFAVWGTPEEFNSDNARQYSSQLFRQFSAEWKFEHVTSSPYYPKSNGLSERAVQIAKNILKKCYEDNSSVQLALLNYRNIPRNSKLLSPNQRLMSRITNSPLPVVSQKLKPEVIEDVKQNLESERFKQKDYYDRSAQVRQPTEVNNRVLLQNPLTKIWESGRIIADADTPRSVFVETDQGDVYRRNMKHVRKSTTLIPAQPEAVCDVPKSPKSHQNSVGPEEQQQQHPVGAENLGPSGQINEERGQQTFTRSGRLVKPIQRLNL